MSETVSAKSVASRVKRSKVWYGRSPASVSLDLSISSDAFRVYSVLSLNTFQGNTSALGLRQLGTLLNKSAATIKRRVDELIKAGHLEVTKRANGRRMIYVFTDPCFGQKQRAGIEEVAFGPSGIARMVSSPRKRSA